MESPAFENVFKDIVISGVPMDMVSDADKRSFPEADSLSQDINKHARTESGLCNPAYVHTYVRRPYVETHAHKRHVNI